MEQEKKRTTFLEQDGEREGIAVGRNAVYEALATGANIDKIYVLPGEPDGVLRRILGMAAEKKILVQTTDRYKLRKLSGTDSHQGILCCISEKQYGTVADILKLAADRGEAPFVVVADEIADPHNLGAIIRTAHVTGAHGVVIPKRRGVGITPAVSKASAGAVFHVEIAKVNNLTAALGELKDAGLWIYGLDSTGRDNLFQTSFSGPAALVVGSEGKGLTRLVRDTCDVLVSIPMEGEFNSLNASVAAGVAMYEILRQKKYAGKAR